MPQNSRKTKGANLAGNGWSFGDLRGVPTWPEMTRHNEIFWQRCECVQIRVDENTSISYANQQRVQNEDTAMMPLTAARARQALLYLARAVTAWQPTAPPAHYTAWNVWDVYHMAQDPWNAAHISSDKQLVEIYEIELIMSLWLAERQRKSARGRVSKGVASHACLPFGFSKCPRAIPTKEGVGARSGTLSSCSTSCNTGMGNA